MVGSTAQEAFDIIQVRADKCLNQGAGHANGKEGADPRGSLKQE